MSKSRILGATTAAILGAVLVAAPASAYVITGWQYGNGWNNIDYCSIYRSVATQRITVAESPVPCLRDVGLRGRGTVNSNGAGFEVQVITWANEMAAQTITSGYTLTGMKVYHGNH